MKERGLVPTPASGAIPFRKGDGQDENWVVEYKWTSFQQFTLKTKDFDKVELAALRAHKRPRMEIEFEDGTYLVVLDKDDFDELIKEE